MWLAYWPGRSSVITLEDIFWKGDSRYYLGLGSACLRTAVGEPYIPEHERTTSIPNFDGQTPEPTCPRLPPSLLTSTPSDFCHSDTDNESSTKYLNNTKCGSRSQHVRSVGEGSSTETAAHGLWAF